jgi:hypothetical protein
MSFNGWDTDSAGNIQVFPVMGWKTATFMKGMNGGFRLEFATDPSLKNIGAVQVIMTAEQVRELGRAMATMADRMEQEVARDKPSGPAN